MFVFKYVQIALVIHETGGLGRSKQELIDKYLKRFL